MKEVAYDLAFEFDLSDSLKMVTKITFLLLTTENISLDFTGKSITSLQINNNQAEIPPYTSTGFLQLNQSLLQKSPLENTIIIHSQGTFS